MLDQSQHTADMVGVWVGGDQDIDIRNAPLVQFLPDGVCTWRLACVDQHRFAGYSNK